MEAKPLKTTPNPTRMKVTRKSLTKRPGDFAVTFEKTNNPLKGNRNLSESHQVTEVTAPERADPPETLRPVWRSRARSAAGWYGQGWGQAAPGMRPLLAQGPSTMSMWKTDRFALGVAGCAMRGIFLCRVDRAVFCGDKNEKRPENPQDKQEENASAVARAVNNIGCALKAMAEDLVANGAFEPGQLKIAFEAETRRDLIQAEKASNPKATVRELAQKFRVSKSQIQRDLVPCGTKVAQDSSEVSDDRIRPIAAALRIT